MRKLLLISLMFFTILCYGQQNYYYQNNGKSLKTKSTVWMEYEHLLKMKKLWTADKDSNRIIMTEPVIYHREIRNDSIINYYEIRSYVVSDLSVEKKKEPENDFVFLQDPIFIYLNKKLPNINLIDIKGNNYSLDKIKGKPTLLNLTAIYCKPCLDEIPRLNQLKKKYKDKVNFIAIFDVERQSGDVEKTLIKYPFDFYILLGTEEFKNQLNIKNLPYNLLIDKDGFIRSIQKKYMDYNDNHITSTLDELIKKQ